MSRWLKTALLGATLAWTNTASAVPVTILHTNDLHSHFRAERTPLGLGGVARLKTAVSRVKAQTPALLVDGGDWSEGSAYYMLGSGRETLRMMEAVGYDVAVVGNHDWLNGPDVLLDAFESSGTKIGLVAANVNLENYAHAERFKRLIPPYVIREVNGAKIAFIGVLTYEKIYDSYFKPVDISAPFMPVAKLAKELKKQVDAVVLVSHNAVAMNEALLKTARDADLVVGGHDHKKLNEPVLVKRMGTDPAWIVEAGSWGRYLGRLDLDIQLRQGREAGKVKLVRYGLTQIDSKIPEDPAILARIDVLERELEGLYREPIFHDHVADLEDDFTRTGPETWMGNLATDAYREATGTDVSFEQVQFVYGELRRGEDGRIRTADVLNAAPAIYSSRTNKSWTVHTLSMSGRVIENLLKIFFSSRTAANGAGIAGSGIEMTYTPLADQALELPGGVTLPLPSVFALPAQLSPNAKILQETSIGGAPIDRDRRYSVAISGGMLAAFRFLNSAGPDIVPLGDLKDTGRESWRVIASHLKARGSFGHRHVSFGNRFRSQAPDLSIRDGDVRFVASERGTNVAHGKILVTVRNVGASPSPSGAKIEIADNYLGTNFALTPQWRPLALTRAIPALQPGEMAEFEFTATLRGENGIFPVLARVSGNAGEVVATNDANLSWFKP